MTAFLNKRPDGMQTLVAQNREEDTDLVNAQGFSIHALHGTAGIALEHLTVK